MGWRDDARIMRARGKEKGEQWEGEGEGEGGRWIEGREI